MLVVKVLKNFVVSYMYMYNTCDKARVYCIVKIMAAARAKKLLMIFDFLSRDFLVLL